MISEEDLVARLRDLRAIDNGAEADSEAIHLVATYLDQLGKHAIADAMRNAGTPLSRSMERRLSLVKG